MIEITDTALQTAAAEGIDAFLRAFTDKYREALGGDPTAETISRLNGEQHSLLAYRIFRDEVTEGGFCQLIQNGYGVYIFDNPFARVMRLWGAERFSKLVYAAKKIYDAHRDSLYLDSIAATGLQSVEAHRRLCYGRLGATVERTGVGRGVLHGIPGHGDRYLRYGVFRQDGCGQSNGIHGFFVIRATCKSGPEDKKS